jgi:C4-dicarboxylate-binding protein DctP
VLTNAGWWKSLPADVRSELEAILAEVSEEVNRLSVELSRQDRQRVIDSGRTEVITLTPEQLAEWSKAMKPVWDRFQGEIGQDLVEAAHASNEP